MKNYLGGLLLAFIMIGCGGNGSGDDSNRSGTVVVMNASATASATTIKLGEDITLDASGSTISSGSINTWTWTDKGVQVSSQERFTKGDFTLGEHTVYVVVKDLKGNEASSSVTFMVSAATSPTKWDGISSLEKNGDNELYITSDVDTISLLLKADPTLPDANISNAQFFINSDNSALSGLKSGTWTGDRFDYVVKDDGVYRLLGAEDYNGVKVQNMNYIVTDKSIEVVIDKAVITNLAEQFTVGVRLNNFEIALPASEVLHKYTDSSYVAKADTSPPIFVLNGANPLVLNVGGTFSDPGVTATDVVSGPATVTTDSSAVDMSTAGFYTVFYTASDTATTPNTATATRIVEVRAATPATALEVKNLGALGESVVINYQTHLVWANDDTNVALGVGETRGCIINDSSATNAQLKSRFEGYCERSDYAGFTDWRVPSALELSKFTVQMAQEGKTPGMARDNCNRVLGIDGDTVSAVWTHRMSFDGKMNYAGYTETSTLTPSGGRCVRGEPDTSTRGLTLQTGELNDAKVVVDGTLMWVNEFNKNNNACLAIHAESAAKGISAEQAADELNASKTFCGDLNYAGFDDWRDPTSDELSNYVTNTNEAHIFIGYEAPCKRLLARDGNVSKAISTRYDTAQPVVGTVSNLIEPLTSSIGLRCVRPTN